MPAPEYDSIDPPQSGNQHQPSAPAVIAPAWHTILLVAGVIALSIHGASRLSATHSPLNRLATYGFTAAMEAGMLAWVAVGLRLKKIPLRSLLGLFSFNVRSVAADLGFALIFWLCSLMVLGTLGMAWSGVEAAFAHRTVANHAAGQAGQTEQALAPGPSQLETLRALAQLAPASAKEIAAWTLLCLLVGFVEEVVFRGYLQRQFIAWTRGGVAAGVLASAVVFGGAHAYQGARGMALLAVFGALFGLLALYRRSLRAGIFAHAWHDWITGLALALLRSSHLI